MLERIKERLGGFGSAAQWVLWALIVGFSVLPLIKTINELMAKIVIWTKSYVLIERFIVPTMARMISSILTNVFGVETVVNSGSIFLITRGLPYELYLNWNCVGWQSLLLLFFSLVTGLQGNHSLRSKLKCVALGLEGIVVVNLLRIVATAILLLKQGYGPAITFHDHLSIIITFAWMGAFWYISNAFILEASTEAEMRPLAERMTESMRNLKLRTLLPDFIYGRRVMGLATMVIILTMTALSGIAVLSAKELSYGNPTTLSFEYEVSPVTVCSVTTKRIMTHPNSTDLVSTHTDNHTTSSKKFELAWSFYLYGPLEQDYEMKGSLEFGLYLYASEERMVDIKLKIRDVNEEGKAHTEADKDFHDVELNASSPSDPITLEFNVSHKKEFKKDHTILVEIWLRSDDDETYYFNYDSEVKHSYLDLPGIVISENVIRLTYLALVIPLFTRGMRRRKRHEADAC